MSQPSTKTDLQIQHDVTAELQWEPAVCAEDIGVQVKDGIVTLSGHVTSHGEKWHAEQAAQRVAGVTGLAVAMSVILPGDCQRLDEDIAHAASQALGWLALLPQASVKVTAENGWITLNGVVDWQYQKDLAHSTVRYLLGVKGVHDQVSIRPAVSRATVKADIEAALLRRARLDASAIQVLVDGTEVTLTGKVHSLAERDLVWQSAWGTRGVHQVKDELEVAA